MDYLNNYLSVLPDYDREQVENLIQENNDLFEAKVITKEEFEGLLAQLANRKEKVTRLKPTGDKLDADHFNDMHAGVDLDLKRLYNSHLIVEKVVSNYNRILKGSLEDIEREIKSLHTRVEELNLKAKGEDSLILKTYGFEEKEKDKYMETDVDRYGHLFLDRDGTPLERASLNRSFHQHFLSLPIKEMASGLHDKDGTVTATITVENKAKNVIRDISHPIQNAISGADGDYWAEAITTSSPTQTKLKKN